MAAPHRPGKLVWLLVILVIVGVYRVYSDRPKTKDLIPWRTDFAAAQKEAQKDGKPMLVDFSADWCVACQEMKRTQWTDPKIASAASKYIPVAIDADNDLPLAAQYHVDALPTLLIVDPKDGSVVRAQDGMLTDNDAFVDWLKK